MKNQVKRFMYFFYNETDFFYLTSLVLFYWFGRTTCWNHANVIYRIENVNSMEVSEWNAKIYTYFNKLKGIYLLGQQHLQGDRIVITYAFTFSFNSHDLIACKPSYEIIYVYVDLAFYLPTACKFFFFQCYRILFELFNVYCFSDLSA